MTDTPIADMVDAMIAKDATATAIAVAVRAMETALPVLPATLPATNGNGRSRKAINQANYRARKAAKSGVSVAMAATPALATQPATPGNAVAASVTIAPLSILSVLPVSASQELPKEEKKQEVEVLKSEPRARSKRAGTLMAEVWYPDDKGMKFAADRGLRLVEIEIEITKFRNYWINRNVAKPRWDLAWENWILNVKGTTHERSGHNRANSVAGPAQTHGDAVVAGVANFAARYAREKSANPGGSVRGCADAAGGAAADRGATGSDRAPPGQPQLLLTGNAGKRP